MNEFRSQKQESEMVFWISLKRKYFIKFPCRKGREGRRKYFSIHLFFLGKAFATERNVFHKTQGHFIMVLRSFRSLGRDLTGTLIPRHRHAKWKWANSGIVLCDTWNWAPGFWRKLLRHVTYPGLTPISSIKVTFVFLLSNAVLPTRVWQIISLQLKLTNRMEAKQ